MRRSGRSWTGLGWCRGEVGPPLRCPSWGGEWRDGRGVDFEKVPQPYDIGLG